jgi:hypothetical protein
MISPITRKLMWKSSAMTAPMTNEDPERSPQPNALAI